jgi:hypothetical protein
MGEQHSGRASTDDRNFFSRLPLFLIAPTLWIVDSIKSKQLKSFLQVLRGAPPKTYHRLIASFDVVDEVIHPPVEQGYSQRKRQRPFTQNFLPRTSLSDTITAAIARFVLGSLTHERCNIAVATGL